MPKAQLYTVTVRGRSFTLGAQPCTVPRADSADEGDVRGSGFLTDALLTGDFAEGATRKVDLGDRWLAEDFEALLSFIRTSELADTRHGGEGRDRMLGVAKLADFLGVETYLEAVAGKPRSTKLACLFARDPALMGRPLGPSLVELVDHALAPLADPLALPSKAICKRGVVVRLRQLPVRCAQGHQLDNCS